MALTKTITELKEMLPNFISNMSEASSMPNMGTAEAKYLIPITGLALYNEIHSKYNTNPGGMTADETNYLKKMRLVAVAYAYHDGMALGHITLTDNGARKIDPSGTVPVAQWEYKKVEKALLELAADATDVLLKFLFEKKPALWTNSDQYKVINGLLIKTAEDFSSIYTLFQPSVTFYAVRNVIADAQELYLQDAIGVDLLTHLLGLTAPDAELIKCITQLKKALAFFTLMKCCTAFEVQFSRNGFSVPGIGYETGDFAGRGPAAANVVDTYKDAMEKDAQIWLSKAKYSLANYFKRTDAPLADTDFKTAFNKGPLASYVDPSTVVLDQSRKGMFIL